MRTKLHLYVTPEQESIIQDLIASLGMGSAGVYNAIAAGSPKAVRIDCEHCNPYVGAVRLAICSDTSGTFDGRGAADKVISVLVAMERLWLNAY